LPKRPFRDIIAINQIIGMAMIRNILCLFLSREPEWVKTGRDDAMESHLGAVG
jgi:hypothetical protein